MCHPASGARGQRAAPAVALFLRTGTRAGAGSTGSLALRDAGQEVGGQQRADRLQQDLFGQGGLWRGAVSFAGIGVLVLFGLGWGFGFGIGFGKAGSAGGIDQFYRHLQILIRHAVAAGQGGIGARGAQRQQRRAQAVYPEADRQMRQNLDHPGWHCDGCGRSGCSAEG